VKERAIYGRAGAPYLYISSLLYLKLKSISLIIFAIEIRQHIKTC